MSASPRAPVPASAIALGSGALPDPRAVRAVLRATWPAVRVGVLRPRGDSTAERSLGFLCGPDRVVAAHFPWPLDVGALRFPDHASHVWLTVRGYEVARRRDALRLLARATAAATRVSDATCVWWSTGDRVLAPAVFVASAGEQA